MIRWMILLAMVCTPVFAEPVRLTCEGGLETYPCNQAEKPKVTPGGWR